MTNYLIRRAVQMIIVVLLASLAVYILLNIAPGGPLSGLRLTADRRARLSDAEIARLEAYLGLDKPLMLRYLAWLLGDDWLGADWMYLGARPYEQLQVGRDGNPVIKIDRNTGQQSYVYDYHRFWSDPGLAQLNPGYSLWIWGREVEQERFVAETVQVKPPSLNRVPEDITVWGRIISQSRWEVVIEDLNNRTYTVVASENTEWLYPEGEARPRPAEGRWISVAWLFGPGGLLGEYAGLQGDSKGILRLDFGRSWKLAPSQPVSDLIRSRLSNTFILMTSALLLSLFIGIPIGIYSALHQYSKTDYAVTTFAFFGSAMPIFWFGLMLILVFSYQFKNWGMPYFPTGGISSVRPPPTGSILDAFGATPGSLLDRAVHILLPVVMLSLLYVATWSRYSRSSMLEVLRQDYIRTARAKGLIERWVILKHALRNALIPIVTILVIDVAALFGGAILTETIFSYPGMGRLYFDALNASDWPVVMAYLLLTAFLVVTATLVRDILYSIIDPRIRYA